MKGQKKPNFIKSSHNCKINKNEFNKNLMKTTEFIGNLEERQKQFDNQNYENILMETYCFKPPFFSYFDKNLQKVQKDFKFNTNLMHSRKIIATIRGIFDSKFNEMLIESPKNLTHFSSFAYSWLGKFNIHESKRNICLIQEEDSKKLGDEIRVIFFCELQNPKLDKFWDCITFKDFLYEKSSIDEIYFYLHYRYIILI